VVVVSAARFTPGPWQWFPSVSKERRAVIDTAIGVDSTNGTIIAEVERGKQFDANARLIAAAPELYDACVDTLDALNRLRDGFELSPRNTVRDAALLMIDQHVDLLETVLFKARGGQ
jgi:hypothetical protein